MKLELSQRYLNKEVFGDYRFSSCFVRLFLNPIDEPIEITLDGFDDLEYSGPDKELKDRSALLRAISYAVKDMLDTDSSLYQDVYLPFSKYKQTSEVNVKVTFLSKLIQNILTRDRSGVTLDAYMYIENNQEYFSFSVPEHVLDEVLSESEKEVLFNTPKPGFSLLELGQYSMVNYVLGFYYEYLAKWCEDSTAAKVRDLKCWSIGLH